MGDKGSLFFESEEVHVFDTKKENQLIVHFTDKLPANIKTSVLAKVDTTKRHATAIHHSATHLLHAALRKVLGIHVTQKGSLVNEEHLRFDFSHFAKVSEEELSRIEAIVNEKIRENIPVIIKEMSKDEAVTMGAMALFGEKYGDVVRVVMMDPHYSIELCGGTHARSTGALGFFKLQHETAVAAGVRRIEAVCGKAAEELVLQQFNTMHHIRETLKNPKDVLKGLQLLLQENVQLKKQLESLETKQLAVLEKELVSKMQDVNGVSFIGEMVEVNSADSLKKLCFDLRKHVRNYLVVLVSNIEGKASVAVMIDENLAAQRNLEAPKIIKEHVALLIRGGGGGQKTLATAGGQDASNLDKVLDKIKALLN